ncbi:hypothetical protein WT83_04710 [Burkholderia territorii]|uniref:Uncharacterized protein n=1 Tax=Burkholderia territorii TaxID=1503055 RepID=A0A108F4A2_9BURK|nr:hypothetical protein WT83_04710 [Burkholderia territorii]
MHIGFQPEIDALIRDLPQARRHCLQPHSQCVAIERGMRVTRLRLARPHALRQQINQESRPVGRHQRLEIDRETACHRVRIAGELMPDNPFDVVPRVGTTAPALVRLAEERHDTDVVPTTVGMQLDCAGDAHFGGNLYKSRSRSQVN